MWRGAVALFAAAATAVGQQPAADDAKEANLKAYVDLLRKDVKKEKVAIVSDLMQLSPEDSAKFWPVYNEYDKALTALADERLALIRMYAASYGHTTDQTATKLANGVFELDDKRNQLKRQYFDRMSKTLNAVMAFRFLQIDTQLEKIIDLQIVSSLPVIE
jgi:hypothetical protein